MPRNHESDRHVSTCRCVWCASDPDKNGKVDPVPNPILRYFSYDHLPMQTLRDVSVLFFNLAHGLNDALPDGPEKSVALRKLLESKDAAVRAAL